MGMYDRALHIHVAWFTFTFVHNLGLLVSGLGQVQLKMGDLKSSLSNFEKVLEIYPDNCETLKVSWRQSMLVFMILFCSCFTANNLFL